jgi:hypothetical protein
MSLVSQRLGLTAVALAATLGLASAARAQSLNPNEKLVEPGVNVQDRGKIWVLHLNFMPPRTITVDVPGRGKKVVWYMWYQVINKSDEPHTFIPDFKLVTSRDTVHNDEVLPSVQEAIRKIEDPTGRMDIQNSVTISSKPIPPSKPDAAPKAVTGVAIWPDVTEKAKDMTHFSVFVSGLSNGWSIDDRNTVRRKTLQLNFRRAGDGNRLDPNDVKWIEPAQWRYLAADTDFPGAMPPPKKPGAAATPAEPKESR